MRTGQPLIADVYYDVLVALEAEHGTGDYVEAAVRAGSQNWRMAMKRMSERGWVNVVGRQALPAVTNRGMLRPRAIYALTERGQAALTYGRLERMPESATL